MLLGGVFTDTIGWEWIFLLNVPVGLAVIASAPFLLRESRAQIALYAGVGLAVAGALAVMALVRSSRGAEASVETVVAETASEGSTS